MYLNIKYDINKDINDVMGKYWNNILYCIERIFLLVVLGLNI